MIFTIGFIQNSQKLYLDGFNQSPIKRLLHISLLLTCLAQVNGQDILKDSLYIRSFGTADYRASEFNYSVAEDENGILFFANENGILEYDGSNWRMHPLPDYSQVITLEMGPDGRLYVGGRNEFGYMERDSTGTMHYTSLRSTIDKEFEFGPVWQILFRNGSVYFQNYESIIRFDGELGHKLPIKNGWLFEIGGELYASVIEKGIAKFEGDSLKFLNTEIKLKEDNPMRPMGQIGREKILPTEYNGLFLLDTVTFKTRKWDVPASKELIKHGIYDGTEWGDDMFMFSTVRNGLVWINKRGEVVRILGKADGLKSTETRSFHRDSKGNLWIPGYGIHHMIWPDKQRMDDFFALIRSLEINGVVFPINSSNLKMDSDFPAPIRSLTFNFSSPGFDKSDLQYAYKLDGFDQEWSEWSNNSIKHYTNLDGGNYTFHVKSRINGGQESIPATLELFVPTLWYRTGWAKVGAGLLLWFLIMAVYKWRTNQLKNQNRRLEEIVEQRTHELRAANEELVTKNHELDQFVRRVSHDLVAPLKSVKALMAITQEETEPAEQQKCFDMMKLSLDKQEEFVKRMLDQAVNYREVKKEPVELYKLCMAIRTDLNYYEGASQIDFILDCPKDYSLLADPDRLKIVISNLMSNAIKYRRLDEAKPIIIIRAKNEGNTAIIQVEDNGLGIEEKSLGRIFDMFVRVSDQSHGSGLGLYIVKDMVKKMGGNIMVDSELGKGTTFTLTIPQGK